MFVQAFKRLYKASEAHTVGVGVDTVTRQRLPGDARPIRRPKCCDNGAFVKSGRPSPGMVRIAAHCGDPATPQRVCWPVILDHCAGPRSADVRAVPLKSIHSFDRGIGGIGEESGSHGRRGRKEEGSEAISEGGKESAPQLARKDGRAKRKRRPPPLL